MNTKIEPAFWRASVVVRHVGLPLRFLLALEREGKFPPSTRLSERVRVWSREAVLSWITDRNQARHQTDGSRSDVRADYIRGEATPRRRTRRTQPTGGVA